MQYDTVQAVRITRMVTEFEVLRDTFGLEVRDLFEWVRILVRRWNQMQMVFLTAIFSSEMPESERSEQIRRAVDHQTTAVAAMRYRMDQLEDRSLRGALDPLVANYQERVRLVRSMAGAAVANDEILVEELGAEYRMLTDRRQLQQILEDIYDHPRVRAVAESLGLSIDAVLSSLLDVVDSEAM